jgi:hypothetical protein
VKIEASIQECELNNREDAGNELARALDTLGAILNGHDHRITPSQANALLFSHEQMSATIQASPFYLDGLSIVQWREHAKAGWAATENKQAAALERYDRLKACTSRWHALSVSMGYDGVEPALLSLQAMKRGPVAVRDEGGIVERLDAMLVRDLRACGTCDGRGFVRQDADDIIGVDCPECGT